MTTKQHSLILYFRCHDKVKRIQLWLVGLEFVLLLIVIGWTPEKMGWIRSVALAGMLAAVVFTWGANTVLTMFWNVIHSAGGEHVEGDRAGSGAQEDDGCDGIIALEGVGPTSVGRDA